MVRVHLSYIINKSFLKKSLWAAKAKYEGIYPNRNMGGGSYAELHGAHHYETLEVKDSSDVIIVPKGLECESDYSITYFDSGTGIKQTVLSADCTTEVTNYTYEERIEDKKRNIYVLKQRYIGVIQDDMEIAMAYRKGSTQYVDPKLKQAENIKLYQ